MATKKPSVLEYITFGTTAYTVGSALIPALRAKKIVSIGEPRTVR